MPSNPQHTCTCGHHYDAEQWAALPLVARLTPSDVSPLVTLWPSHRLVEARQCAHCNRLISRLVEEGRQVPGKHPPAHAIAQRSSVAKTVAEARGVSENQEYV